MTTAASIVQRLLEDDFEADLKRYTTDIYQSSNLNNATFKRWLKSQNLSIDPGTQDLRTFWRTHQNGSNLIKIAASANVPHKKIVLAACACARLALKCVPEGEDRPRRAIEAAEALNRGEITTEEVEQAMNDADDASIDYRGYPEIVNAAYAASAVADAAIDSATANFALMISQAAYAAGRAAAAVGELEVASTIKSIIPVIDFKPNL